MIFPIERSRRALMILEKFYPTVSSDWARDYWDMQIKQLKRKIIKHDALNSIR